MSEGVEIVDVGVNFTHRSFRGDLPQVIAAAREAHVAEMVITGTSVDGSLAARELAEVHGLYATAGVHPHHAKDCDAQTIDTLRKLAGAPEVVAVGETGLDYNRDFSPRPVQDEWFERQIELGIELEMPLFLHQRDAHDRFVEILGRHGDSLPRAVVHCFTGTEAELDAYLAMDLYIGITGWICDERRGGHLMEIVGKIPSNRLMIETDAPFLLPRSISPKPKSNRNEPRHLVQVLSAVAKARGESTSAVAAATTETARAFFSISKT